MEVHKSNSANAGFDAGRGRVAVFPKDVAELAILYDDEVAYVDGKIGEVLTFLKSNGLDENTLVVITSDHGEHFGEHGLMSHQYSVYEPLVRVPLLVHPARFKAGREERMVQSHDIYPTILELARHRLEAVARTNVPEPVAAGLGGAIWHQRIFGTDDGCRAEGLCLEHLELDCTRLDPPASRDPTRQFEADLFLGAPFWVEAKRSRLYDLANDPTESRNLAVQKLDDS